MKYCLDCGCIMPDNHIGDYCECCLDDRGDTIPDGLRETEESLYPKIFLTTSGPVRETLDKILENRLAAKRNNTDQSAEWSKVTPFIFHGYGRLGS